MVCRLLGFWMLVGYASSVVGRRMWMEDPGSRLEACTRPHTSTHGTSNLCASVCIEPAPNPPPPFSSWVQKQGGRKKTLAWMGDEDQNGIAIGGVWRLGYAERGLEC
ncbi:hypothetical protein K505DRAFT_58320 [Melanomma pulvis-pyrius CBS 109.77]|uniref:Secreted protein n=1 Tax=Melanomma pulvis-pyrius CBS 109.77 TaxID=1314802 RepID=A0A6A6XSL9_9PLEO|nr:hypothetical protein K505DRAFT_58320 [Melanomma pulvis-pyrius CBS 109.77]